MAAAKKVELFSTLKHLTSSAALESIFNEGFYGRRTLMQFYLPFKPASLSVCDIDQGDANVICFGASEIDPLARHGIELTFDASKIVKANRNIFYKQKDLYYKLRKIRQVKIGRLDLCFNHTYYDGRTFHTSRFVLFAQVANPKIIAWGDIKNDLLISYNTTSMHQILTLNFFRFIDGLHDVSNNVDEYHKQLIYAAFNELDDQVLVETLQKLGQQMTDTMEFNFYGGHKIDFSTLLSIKNDSSNYVLNLTRFIEELANGDISKLDEAIGKLPEIFKSYRFIDYLQSVISNDVVLTRLSEIRNQCKLPTWLNEVSCSRMSK